MAPEIGRNGRDAITDRSRQDATPTLIVGLGDAGMRDSVQMLEKAKAENIAGAVEMVGINTRADFPDVGDRFTRLQLSRPESQYIASDLRKRPYISEDQQVNQMAGSRRNPEVARYLADTPDNIVKVEQKFKTTIHSFIKPFVRNTDHNVDAVNIIITLGAGGGSGNGLFPLVTGMIHRAIINFSESDGPLSTVNFHVFPVFGVSTIRNTSSEGKIPDVEPKYLENTAGLLKQAATLAGRGPFDFPLEIPLISADEANIQHDSYKIERNPFEAIYTIAVVENGVADVERYRSFINRTAAAIFYRWAQQDSETRAVENAVDDLNNVFYEVRGAEFRAPTDRIEEYFETCDRIDRIREQRDEAEETVDRIGAALEEIRSAIDAAHSESGVEISGDQEGTDELIEISIQSDGGIVMPIDQIHEQAIETATGMDFAQATDETIDNRVDTMVAQHGDQLHESLSDTRIIGLIFYRAVFDRLADEMEGHGFPAAIRRFVDEHHEALAEYDPAFQESAPVDVLYCQVIKPFLQEQLDDLEAQYAETTLLLNRSKRVQLRSKISATERTLDRLGRLASEYARLTSTREAIQERIAEIRSEIEETVIKLRASRSETMERLERLEDRLSVKRNDRENLRDELMSATVGRSTTLPITDPDKLDRETIGEDPGLEDLLGDVIDRERAISTIVNTLKTSNGSPLTDRLETAGEIRNQLSDRPIVIAGESELDSLWLDAEANEQVTDVAAQEFDNEPELITHQEDDRMVILVEYGGLSLKNVPHPATKEEIENGPTEVAGIEVDTRNGIAYPSLVDINLPIEKE